MGFYWIYFSSQKWFDDAWVKPILEQAARSNPIPILSRLMDTLVLPNWLILTRAQTILEAAIGILLLIGLLTRVAGSLGGLLAAFLLISFLGSLDAPVFVWFYILTSMTSVTVALSDAGKELGLDGLLAKRWKDPPLGLW